jgi:16S rRNA processing protein RimM
MNGELEILVPLIDTFIIEVDRKNKIFKMDIPEGIVEMYL